MSQLVPQQIDVEKAVKDGKISWNDLMQVLAQREADQHAAEQEKVAASPSGKALALTETTRVLLRTIPVELSNITLPGEARHLAVEESEKLIPLYDQLKQAATALKNAEDAIKQAFHNHIDQDAPEGSTIDKAGHALTEGEIAVDGLDKKVVRGRVGGKPIGITETDLAELEEAGEIDHKTYLALTDKVPATRTLAAEPVVMAVLAKQPSLVKVLATKARLSDVTTAIRLSKNS